MPDAPIARFVTEEAGATAIEYGLIAALLVVALISTFALMGTSIEQLYASGTGSAAAVFSAAADSLP
ncbi:Flp family type IVb pilin [uncultured Devosia sp.]|uniref:Flp family type IVb pilin n=1 Tax=uncultured Devosia sp. TaxID=211434 RepID=UPI0035CA612E